MQLLLTNHFEADNQWEVAGHLFARLLH